MSKIKLLPKIFAVITAGITICSVQGCKKDKNVQSESSNNISSSQNYDYEVLKEKEYLSNDIIDIVNSQNIGLKDYIDKYTYFSEDYKSFDEIYSECLYYSNLTYNQQKYIYDFAHSYYQYLKSYNNKEIESAHKYITRMINNKRAFGNIKSVFKNLINIDFNNAIPLIYSNDYYNLYNLLNDKEDDSFKGDIIDKEIYDFILFLNIYAKYSLDPLKEIVSNDKVYLANQTDFNNYLQENEDDIYNNDIIKSFTLEVNNNRWYLKNYNKKFKVINSNSLNEYLNDISKKYQKKVFDYHDMVEYGILKMVLFDEKVFGYYNYDLEEYWWPIGSSETNNKDGILYASDSPEDTIIVDGYNYIGGLNGSGVTNIIASKSGLVIYPINKEQIYYENNDKFNKYGNYVIIKHDDGNYTLYSHLSYDSITVMAGEYVEQGQVIGKMGKSGNAMDVYLEFEIRVGENLSRNKVNIYDYVNKNCPRGTNKKHYLK